MDFLVFLFICIIYVIVVVICVGGAEYFWTLLFFGIIILAVILLIIKYAVVPSFENRKRRRLDEAHMLIIPQKQVVRVDVNQTINGYNPYVIDCYYTDQQTGREFVFISPPFMRDPTPYLSGIQLGVFVDPQDYSNYYVDVSQLNMSNNGNNV